MFQFLCVLCRCKFWFWVLIDQRLIVLLWLDRKVMWVLLLVWQGRGWWLLLFLVSSGLVLVLFVRFSDYSCVMVLLWYWCVLLLCRLLCVKYRVLLLVLRVLLLVWFMGRVWCWLVRGLRVKSWLFGWFFRLVQMILLVVLKFQIFMLLFFQVRCWGMLLVVGIRQILVLLLYWVVKVSQWLLGEMVGWVFWLVWVVRCWVLLFIELMCQRLFLVMRQIWLLCRVGWWQKFVVLVQVVLVVYRVVVSVVRW